MASNEKETPAAVRGVTKKHPPRVQSGPLRQRYSTRSAAASPLRVTSDPGGERPSRAQTATGAKSKLDFSEVRGDLFSCPKTASLVHCVSEDMAMGKGIAKEFKKQFGGVHKLKEQGKHLHVVYSSGVATPSRKPIYERVWLRLPPRMRRNMTLCLCCPLTGVKTGGVAVLKRGDRFIYYLVSGLQLLPLVTCVLVQVTKPRYFHKPTYDTLQSSLVVLWKHCVDNGITELCMPRIGCGLDRLEWDKVKEMIQEVFAGSKIAITVYAL